jgi:hypothetical protein
MIFAYASRQDHANQISRKNRFTVGPTRKSAQPEQQEQQIFRFEF